MITPECLLESTFETPGSMEVYEGYTSYKCPTHMHVGFAPDSVR